MIKGITFSDIRKELFLFLFLLIILFPLHGGRSVNATVELTNADKALVNGYVNYYNRIIITLTFNNSGATDLTDYDNGEYLIYYQHAESGSVPTIDMTDNNGNGLSDDVEIETGAGIYASNGEDGDFPVRRSNVDEGCGHTAYNYKNNYFDNNKSRIGRHIGNRFFDGDFDLDSDRFCDGDFQCSPPRNSRRISGSSTYRWCK